LACLVVASCEPSRARKRNGMPPDSSRRAAHEVIVHPECHGYRTHRRLRIPRKVGHLELDPSCREADNITMRRALRLVLVIAALFGLFGQTVAVAASPTAVATQATAPASMPMDCLEMMQGGDDHSVPCDRMTLACVAGMGCSILFTVDGVRPVMAGAMIVIASSAWPLTSALEGRSVQPEPHPPSALA
jgi:hypothetical protein